MSSYKNVTVVIDDNEVKIVKDGYYHNWFTVIENANIYIEKGYMDIIGDEHQWECALYKEWVEDLENKPINKQKKAYRTLFDLFNKNKREYVKGWYRIKSKKTKITMNNFKLIKSVDTR